MSCSHRRIDTGRVASADPCSGVQSPIQLKSDQDALERRLADERKKLIDSHKDAVEKARFRYISHAWLPIQQWRINALLTSASTRLRDRPSEQASAARRP